MKKAMLVLKAQTEVFPPTSGRFEQTATFSLPGEVERFRLPVLFDRIASPEWSFHKDALERWHVTNWFQSNCTVTARELALAWGERLLKICQREHKTDSLYPVSEVIVSTELHGPLVMEMEI